MSLEGPNGERPVDVYGGSVQAQPLTGCVGLYFAEWSDSCVVSPGEAREVAQSILKAADLADGEPRDMTWRTDDPREVMKRGGVIIVDESGQPHEAVVESKHGYYITLVTPAYSTPDRPRRHVSADDSWPEGWRWVMAPA